MFYQLKNHVVSIAFCLLVGLAGISLFVGWITSASAAPSTEGIVISPGYTQQARADQVVIYNHVLTNTGTTTTTFLLTVNSTQQWTVMLLDGTYPQGTARLPLYNVSPQMTVPFSVSLTIPPNADGITEATIITATSQTSPTVQATVTDTTIIAFRLYLPLVLKRWPPVPYKPTLNPITIEGCDGNHSVSWVEQPSRLATTYTLQEAADNACGVAPHVVCSTTQQSCDIGPTLAGTHYYCVRGENSWGYGEWSEMEPATVLPPAPPYLHSDYDADGDGSYKIRWDSANCASSYELEEATDPTFSNPKTVYSGEALSWSAVNNPSGMYYYRVKSNGSTGASEWSTGIHVQVLSPSVHQLEAEAYYHEYKTRPDYRVPDGTSAIHIGGDDGTSDNSSGWVEYRFEVTAPVNNALISMRYADDVGGDTCTFLLDGNLIASLDTNDTGTWDDFVWTSPFSVSAGFVIGPGIHTLRLEVRDSGSWGLTIDKFRIYEGAVN